MEKVDALQQIFEILEEVEATWLANDGGLTMAASDLLSLGRATIAAIKRDDLAWISDLNPWKTDTGQESDIITTAQQWMYTTCLIG